MTQKTKKYQAPQSKHWCFTINNPGHGDLPTGFHEGTVFSYIVIGTEIGDSGTKHLQGYCCLLKRARLTAVKKLFPRAHLERMLGTSLQASVYCKKDGDWVEFGTLPLTAKQAQLAKWQHAYDLCRAGDIDGICPQMQIQYYHAFKRILQDHPIKPPDLDEPCGLWLYGKTGNGKSHYARKTYPNFFDKLLNKWWDGYRNEPTVLLDDIDTSHATWIGPFLKRWSDKYSFPAEVKGTTIQIRPKRIVVTSQHRLEALFQGRLGDALSRRFTEIHIKDSRRRRKFFKKT